MNNDDTRVLAYSTRKVSTRVNARVRVCGRRIGKLLSEICSLNEWILYRTKLHRVHGIIFETFDRETVQLWFTGDIDWYILICNFQISLLCVEEAFRQRTDVLVSLSLSYFYTTWLKCVLTTMERLSLSFPWMCTLFVCMYHVNWGHW